MNVQNKGLIEVVFRAIEFGVVLILKQSKLLLLKLRGYAIDYTCSIDISSTFFQSIKDSIKLLPNVTIGKYVQVKSGFGGKVKVGTNSCIYDYTIIDAQDSIEIGENCLIAPYSYLTDYDHSIQDLAKPINSQGYSTKPIKIGDNVWIGAHTTILKGVRIGNNSIVGANSVVTKHIPAGVIVAGNPAKIIRKR